MSYFVWWITWYWWYCTTWDLPSSLLQPFSALALLSILFLSPFLSASLVRGNVIAEVFPVCWRNWSMKIHKLIKNLNTPHGETWTRRQWWTPGHRVSRVLIHQTAWPGWPSRGWSDPGLCSSCKPWISPMDLQPPSRRKTLLQSPDNTDTGTCESCKSIDNSWRMNTNPCSIRV